MRTLNLQAIRTRVERLADQCGAGDDLPLFIRWRTPYDRCPGCGYDLDEHARQQALANVRQEDGPEAPPRRVIVYGWPWDLHACPRCQAALPDKWTMMAGTASSNAND